MNRKGFLGIAVAVLTIVCGQLAADPSLVLYLSMDRVEDGYIIDLSGYSQKVKLPCPEALAEGKSGQALNTGKGYFLTVPYSQHLKLPPGCGLTIAVWVRLEADGVRWAGLVKNDGGKSTAYQEFKGFNFGTNGSSSPVPLSEAAWRFTVKGQGSETALAGPLGQLLKKGSWVHLVAVYDPSPQVRGLMIYVDGRLVEDYIMIDLPMDINNEADWIIGKDLTCFPGLVDEVKIYRRALSSQEVEEVFQGRR